MKEGQCLEYLKDSILCIIYELSVDIGPIYTISDSSCTTFLTESDIKILHVHTISDTVLGVVHTTPLRFMLTLENKADCSSKRAAGATMYWIHAFTLAQK